MLVLQGGALALVALALGCATSERTPDKSAGAASGAGNDAGVPGSGGGGANGAGASGGSAGAIDAGGSGESAGFAGEGARDGSGGVAGEAGRNGSAGGNSSAGGSMPESGGAAGEHTGIGGSTAGAAGEGGGAEPNRDWALWPMPNPASVGLPHAASYDITTDPLVALDLVTGLMWKRAANEFNEALPARAACSDLELAGYDDWRLPTMIEMFSIVEWSDTTVPFLDTSVFSGITSDSVWTSTPSAGSPDTGAWVMGLGYLSTITTHAVNSRFRSFCVRAGASPASEAHYVISEETVLDAYTGLTWERNASLDELDESAGIAYCEGLELSGQVDWRLPSIGELATIEDFSTSRVPSLDRDAFPDDGGSAGHVDFLCADSWTFDFWNIRLTHHNSPPTARVRCVR